jgi:hypothetical protein
VVPGDFGLEGEGEGFFEESNADFARVGRGGCGDEGVGHGVLLSLLVVFSIVMVVVLRPLEVMF